eukprot:COSAG05_NODE_23166_length_260_cov_0.459627_1_plen_62_part_01
MRRVRRGFGVLLFFVVGFGFLCFFCLFFFFFFFLFFFVWGGGGAGGACVRGLPHRPLPAAIP